MSALKEWKISEQYTICHKIYDETWQMHDRLKSRIFSYLSLLLTITIACIGVAATKGDYRVTCGVMGISFLISCCFCLRALSPLEFNGFSGELYPERMENILAYSPTTETEIAAKERLIEVIDDINKHNLKALQKPRKDFQHARFFLVLSPFLGLVSIIVSALFSL